LGLTYTQAMFMEMLVKSRIHCECEKRTLLSYRLYTGKLWFRQNRWGNLWFFTL